MAIERNPMHVCQERRKRNPIRQKTDSAEDPKPLPNLPNEINVEILLRLPIKPLLRFRCVSKSWRSLISNPKFAKTHLSLASSNTDYTHDRLLLSLTTDLYRHADLKSCSISAITYEQSHTAVSLDCPYDGPPDWFSIVAGSCNGLVCITTQNKTVILLNPSTRKSRRLPKVGFLFHEHTKYEFVCPVFVFGFCRSPVYGFGYDESIDDYKVVVIFQVQVNNVERQNRAAVYMLRTDSWRRIGDCPHPFELIGPGKFASGALHWIPSFGSKEIIIVSLYLATETYGEVPQPECVHSRRHLTMDVLGGCLCVLCDCEGKGVELWVMKEYGIRESWTKLVAIHDTKFLYAITPICFFKNGDILMVVKGCLVRYNSKDGEFCYPMIHKYFHPFSDCSYIGSLVSPSTDADTGV